MNVKMNDKQKSHDRTAEEQTSDDQYLTKINSWWTAWRSLLKKFFADENFLLYRNLSPPNVPMWEHDFFVIFYRFLGKNYTSWQVFGG